MGERHIEMSNRNFFTSLEIVVKMPSKFLNLIILRDSSCSDNLLKSQAPLSFYTWIYGAFFFFFKPIVEEAAFKNLYLCIPVSMCVTGNERLLGEKTNCKKGEVPDYIFALFLRLLVELEKATLPCISVFPRVKWRWQYPLAVTHFYLIKKGGVAIRINEMMFVNSSELFGRQMFYKYKLLIKYLYWWLQGMLTVLE